MLHKGLITVAFVIVLGALWVPRSQTLFFLRTHQHNVDLSGFNPMGLLATYEGRQLEVPIDLDNIDQAENLAANVLGKSSKDKRIEIDLTNQKLKAYEGNKKKFEFLISSGNPWTQTPTGTYYPWIKLRYTNMEGGNQAFGTYYNLPNVPYVMFFYNEDVPKWQGYGLHGTYWHNDFGRPKSHGCVNAPTEKMGEVFEWADLDTKIVIYGETPGA